MKDFIIFQILLYIHISCSSPSTIPQCLISNNNERLDCHPEPNANRQSCLNRKCCWSEPLELTNELQASPASISYCYYPKNYPNYAIENIKKFSRGIQAKLVKQKSSYLPHDILSLNLDIIYETNSRVRIRITDTEHKRFEVPIRLNAPDSSPPTNTDYEVFIPSDGSFSIDIKRKSDNLSLFKSFGPLLYSDQFLQISTLMSTDQVYGIGEQNRPFLHQLGNGWTRIGLWARDYGIETYNNLYGTHPFYMGMPVDGKAFGVFYFNSNAQEFALQPAPAITYRSIGGILDIFIFTGGTPEDTVKQYVDLIGKPMLPPYWSLGFHLSRWGYESIGQLSETFQRNIDAGFPVGIQWSDIDYMNNFKDFTIDQDKFSGLDRFIREIRQKYNSKFVVIIDSGISCTSHNQYPPYYEGLSMDIFIKDSQTNNPIIGKVWPGETVYPDFTHPNITMYWYRQIRRFYNSVPVDGLWIDMNEPSNFYDGSKKGCQGNSKYDNPFFIPNIRDQSLIAKTICSSALHFNNERHYNLHNLYGYTESVTTNKALLKTIRGKRPFILSRSTFSGSGKYTFHWTGDNEASWDHLKNSIRQVLNFNMFGIPMTGADICGFNGNSTEELCIRWMQLGAFYPFMRNHNSKNVRDQDPASWSPEAQKIMKTSIQTRFALMPHFYTSLIKSHLNGGTVMRPMSFEFYSDRNTHGLDLQFMIGSSIMVVPVVDQNARKVNAYFPAGVWYDFQSGNILYSNSKGAQLSLDAPLDRINIALRGGHIVPMLFDSTTNSRMGTSNKIILYCVLTENLEASGDLYWDDGENIDSYTGNKYNYFKFIIDQNKLNISVGFKGYEYLPVLSKILILAVKQSNVTNVFINNNPVKYQFNSGKSILIIDNLNLALDSNNFISWN